MFKVKKKSTGEIVQVLSVIYDDTLRQTHFLIWDKTKWAWRPANGFVPPNYEEEIKKEENGNG